MVSYHSHITEYQLGYPTQVTGCFFLRYFGSVRLLPLCHTRHFQLTVFSMTIRIYYSLLSIGFACNSPQIPKTFCCINCTFVPWQISYVYHIFRADAEAFFAMLPVISKVFWISKVKRVKRNTSNFSHSFINDILPQKSICHQQHIYANAMRCWYHYQANVCTAYLFQSF